MLTNQSRPDECIQDIASDLHSLRGNFGDRSSPAHVMHKSTVCSPDCDSNVPLGSVYGCLSVRNQSNWCGRVLQWQKWCSGPRPKTQP
jgi:hypothetical protein